MRNRTLVKTLTWEDVSNKTNFPNLSLTREQLDQLIAIAGPDALMVRLTFNHGLRVSKTLSITAENIQDGHLSVKRGKQSNPVCHQLLTGCTSAVKHQSSNVRLTRSGHNI